MKLIFENGDKLYKKEQSLNANILENVYGIKLYTYQKQIINSIIKDENFDHCIYGDDFKIELISRNIENRCAITIKDYDENQKFENDICVDFNKDELDQFINLLQITRNKM